MPVPIRTLREGLRANPSGTSYMKKGRKGIQESRYATIVGILSVLARIPALFHLLRNIRLIGDIERQVS